MSIYNLESLTPPQLFPNHHLCIMPLLFCQANLQDFFPIIAETTLARIITYDKYGKIRDFGIYSKAYVSFPAL